MAPAGLQAHSTPGARQMGLHAPLCADLGATKPGDEHPDEDGHQQWENLRPIQDPMKASDKGFSMISGRPKKKPWEKKATIVLRLEQETYQRIRRLAARKGCSVSQAAERLFRTTDSEKIEPTLPVDYSHILTDGGHYTIYQLLNTPI